MMLLNPKENQNSVRTDPYFNRWDAVALLVVLCTLGVLAWSARQMATPYEMGEAIAIHLDPRYLPFYASRTVIRMLLAMMCSLLFTFTFGTWAAKSARAARLIIPIIDILQSVPILGFLSVSVPIFIGFFPGSLLGPECAAIFLIFTSQAWNMALGFYQTMRSVPSEIKEAARMFHLSSWQRFWRIEVPYSMPSLLWNAMASMSAGWFFVVAAEALTISNQTILLPGIGSYIAVAIAKMDKSAMAYAVFTMFIVILIYDQLFFRPLVAWAEKFKSEQLVSEEFSESWVINLMRRTRFMRQIGSLLAFAFDRFVNNRLMNRVRIPMIRSFSNSPMQSEWVKELIWWLVTASIVVSSVAIVGVSIESVSLHEWLTIFMLGLITAFRVFVLIILCSLLWVPIGVWIGLNPAVMEWAQPIAQILSAFPANLLYPFVVMLIVTYHLNPNIWLTPLMILGAQWYILLNVIAGAARIPKDLVQVVDNFGVVGWLRWVKLWLPSIFPYYITGAMTAAGGAWNASIVAEVAVSGNQRIMATGLGAYITEATAAGNFQAIASGIAMMCVLVLCFNRLVWRPLYAYAEERFVMEG